MLVSSDIYTPNPGPASTSQPYFKLLSDIAEELSSPEIAFPVFLDLTFKVIAASKDPLISVDKLVVLLNAEPLLGALLVQMANSAAYSLSGAPVTNVKGSVLRLGLAMVKSVASTLAMRQMLSSRDLAQHQDLSHALWRHSLMTASLCRCLAKKYPVMSPDDALFLGLIHDMGAFYLLSSLVRHSELRLSLDETRQILIEWQGAISHALLTALHVPDTFVQAIVEQDDLLAATAPTTPKGLLAVATGLAEHISGWQERKGGPAPIPPFLQEEDANALTAEALLEANALEALLSKA